ncbi:MAG: MBL fold metallo-hydrolase [Ruminococcaceae bacterium]|nr:MBL fold metallo-hydrolase [Oscillospiraceae bacterium]
MRIYKFPVGMNQTNCYFMVDEVSGKCAVVDPGDECAKLMQKLSDKKLSVECIILTHGHFDHIMALDEMRKLTGAKAYIHEADNELLTDAAKSYLTWAGITEGCKSADVLLKDGDEIKVGESTIKVMHTPGHTPGCICLISGSDMISGDTLFRGNIGRYDLYGGNYPTLMSSLQKIAEIEENFKVYPGHGASTTLEHEKETNFYLR